MRYLIIGDGDFSFSLTLAIGHESPQAVHLVATSLESCEQLGHHPNVAENIRQLEQLGAQVLHSVDGTALKKHRELSRKAEMFDRIIFNFPHSGGKGNIAENRQLLCEFFRSSSGFLAEGGEVLVALCRGQGGTPPDCTDRGYGNSWKVVEMAAEGGLILSNVRPFRPQDYPGYMPSGYRGQNRGFLLEGALVHTFTLPQQMPSRQVWRPALPKQNLFRHCKLCYSGQSEPSPVPSYLQDQLACPILSQPWHPVVRVRDILLGVLEQQRHIWKSVESHHEEVATVHLLTRTMAEHLPVAGAVHGSSLSVASSTDVCHHQWLAHSLQALTQTMTSPSGNDRGPACLRVYCSAEVKSAAVSLSPSEQPITHEAIGVLAGISSVQEVETLCSSFEQALVESLTTVLSSSTVYQLQRPKMEVVSCSSLVLWHHKEVCFGSHGNMLTVARCGVYGRSCDQQWLVLAVNLDTLAMLYFGIDDVRLLWSKDVRFAQQFLKEDQKSLIFEPFSLFSPTYTHDVSFWLHESDCKEALEMNLGHLIREVAGNHVISLNCVDCYRPAGSSVIGYCYRLRYQAVGGALSRGRASELQLRLREKLKEKLHLELR